jgi:hypothetical protein
LRGKKYTLSDKKRIKRKKKTEKKKSDKMTKKSMKGGK